MSNSVNLLALTSKKVTDVATFIKENASANKLKYVTEANVTHRLYFPLHKDEEGKLVPYIMAVPIHAWGEGANYDSCICTKGVKVEGTAYDGSCPVCERLKDASEIVKYVKNEKEANCTLVGDARKKFVEELDKQLWKERKVTPAAIKYYVAIVKLNCDKDGKALADGEGDKFSIHIAAWTKNTMQKFLDALTMQDDEPEVGGREFKVKYGDYNDAMTRTGQAQVSVVDGKKALVQEGNALYAAIYEALGSFDFEHSVELSRPEVKSQTPAEIKVSMDALFREWDNYKAALAVNPDAKYLEYSAVGTPATSGGTEAPTPPVGAIASGPQTGTTGGEVSVDELDKALGL